MSAVVCGLVCLGHRESDPSSALQSRHYNDRSLGDQWFLWCFSPNHESSCVKGFGPSRRAAVILTGRAAYVLVFVKEKWPQCVDEASQVNAMSRHLVPGCGYFKLCSLTLSKDMSSCAKWCFLLAVEYQNFMELIKILTAKLGSQTGPVDMVFGDIHAQKLRGGICCATHRLYVREAFPNNHQSESLSWNWKLSSPSSNWVNNGAANVVEVWEARKLIQIIHSPRGVYWTKLPSFTDCWLIGLM